MLYVVVNNGSLKIFLVEDARTWTQIPERVAAEAGSHERDLHADRPGRMFSPAARSHVSLELRHLARALSWQGWARAVAEEMRPLAEKHRDGFVLVASARLLGVRPLLPLSGPLSGPGASSMPLP